jgi:X-X-X-Leu-X-X-Gly heptad repeat protein
MNKTLMLVICDFLLLSMLALARFDPPETLPEATLDATASSATAEAELISLLEESLESELQSRSNLNENLAETREDLEQKARSLAEREAALAATQKSLEEKAAEAAQLAAAKASIETEQQQLAAEKAQVEADSQALAQKFESTRTELESAQTERIELTQTLGQLKEESSVTKERLSQTEEALIAREVALAQREAELKAAQEEAKRLDKEREILNRKLQVAEAERALLKQNLSQEQQEKQKLRAEKARAIAHADRLTDNVSELGAGVSQLGQGVTELAQTSEDIKKEMDASRPRTMSEIFTRFQNNRATIRFTSTEKPRIGNPVTRNYESKSILISDPEGTYLVTHTADTPFAFSKNPDSILGVQLEVTLAGNQFPIQQIAFLSADPRLLFIPLPPRYVEASNFETFELALQPERWEEAVLIKNDESNFGRTGFRRLTSSERFLKMERPALGELFADFASSRGDLAFTKNSQFIGVLSDTKHAVVIDAFLASAIADLGSSFSPRESAATISRLKDRMRKLPNEVR